MRFSVSTMMSVRAALRIGGCLAAAVGAAALLGGSSARAQNLLSNAGFEDPTLDAWTLSGNGGLTTYANYSGFGGSGALPAYGTNLFEFNGGNLAPNAVLAQTITTNPGVRYTVSFLYGDFSDSSGATTQAVIVAAYNGALTATQIATTTPTAIGSQTFSSSAPGLNGNFPTIYGSGDAWSFVATGTSTTVAFADSGTSTTNSSDGVLDNVNASASAPEPSEILLFAFGALPIIGVKWCRGRNK